MTWRPATGRASDIAVPAWRAAVAQSAMELRLITRRPENLLVTIVIPVALLLFFSAAPVLSTGAARPADFLLPGVLALAVISTSMVNLGIATAYERSYGVLKRLGGSPLTRPGLLAAKIAAVAVVEVLQVALLLAVAAGLLGWSPGATGSPFVVAGGLALGTVAFAGLGLFMAGALRAEATLAGANGLYLVFLLLGGIVLPLDHLPAPLEAFARGLPASALSDIVRIGLGAVSGDAAGPALVLAAWAIGSVALAARTFRWD